MSNCYTPTDRIGPEDYVSIQPEGRAECVIRSKFVSELNSAYENKPATVYIQDPALPPDLRKKEQVVLVISNEEYTRLRTVLTGLPPVPTQEEFKKMVKAIENNPTVVLEETPETEEAPKKGSTKK
jgi:hypothetical protein